MGRPSGRSRIMSGWHSLADVGTLHVLLKVFGVLAAAIVIATGMTAYHFWSRWSELIALAERARAVYLPRWRPDMAMTLHNGFTGVAILGVAALAAFAYAASAYGHRKAELITLNHAAALAREQAGNDALRIALAEQQSRTANATETHRALQQAARESQHMVRENREALQASRNALRESEHNLHASRNALRESQAALQASQQAVQASQDALREAEVRHLAEAASLRRDIERAEKRRAIAQSDRDNEIRLTAQIETLHRAARQADQRHAAEIATLRKALETANVRRVASTESLRWEVRQAEAKAAREIEAMRDKLGKAERKLAALQEVRRLSVDEKNELIDALSPFAGQRVLIAAIEGDEDGKNYATDFAEVFEAAGWVHPQIDYRRWERDPVGVEISLNEQDGRTGRINSAIGTLINVTRKLSLTDANTVYMNEEVPSGQVQIKIGKKQPR
jgi:hypothetical protein